MQPLQPLITGLANSQCSGPASGAQEWQYAKVRQDAQLERIEKGIGTLGDMARGMQEELDKQDPVIDDIDHQINKVTGQLKSNNARLTGLVTQVGALRCAQSCDSAHAGCLGGNHSGAARSVGAAAYAPMYPGCVCCRCVGYSSGKAHSGACTQYHGSTPLCKRIHVLQAVAQVMLLPPCNSLMQNTCPA